MRIPPTAWLTAAVAVVLVAQPAAAQWDWNKTRTYGMFGERQLGETIKPEPSTRFSNGFWRGPSGNFLGRDSTKRGMMFPSPYRNPQYGPAEVPYESPNVTSRQMTVREPRAVGSPYHGQDASAPWREVRPALPGEGSRAAPFEEAPRLEEAPQIWFRGKTPPGDLGAAVPRATTAAGPGIALAGSGSMPRPRSSAPVGYSGGGSTDTYLSSALEAQIAKVARFQSGEQVRVSVAGGVATLRGSVATQHDRKVLAEFVRMEPGVWNVDNQLTVQPKTP